MEKLVHDAKIIFTARLMGNINEISKENVARLYSLTEGTYGRLLDKRNIF